MTPGYFDALRIPLRQGRFFDDRDRAGQPLTVIVNETMAKRYWPRRSPIGQFIRFDNRRPFEVAIVGVVPDVHYRMVREEQQPSFYVPLAQVPAASGVLHVQFGSDPFGRLDELRRVVAAINPAVPVTRIGTLGDQIERNISDERMAGAIGVALAGVALVLATAGLYATMAFVVDDERARSACASRSAPAAQTSGGWCLARVSSSWAAVSSAVWRSPCGLGTRSDTSCMASARPIS